MQLNFLQINHLLLIEPPDINEGSGLAISPMVSVHIGRNVCIGSANSTILSCMLVKDDITNPKICLESYW